MTRLLLVRHGETDLNAERRFQGHIDQPLNETGRFQATTLQKRLANTTLDAIISSDLRRAVETAEIITHNHPQSITPDSRWRELNFGEWEGMTYAEIKAAFPQQLAAWEADTLTVPPTNGETLQQLAERIQAALGDLRQTHPEGTILLVAHGGVLQTLLCITLGLPAERHWQFRLDTASLSEINFYPAGVIINRLNEVVT